MKTTELRIKISECHVMEETSEVTACRKLNVRGEVGYHLSALYLFSFRTFLVRIIDLVQSQSTSIWYLDSGFEFISFTRLFTPSDFINIALKNPSKECSKEFWKTVTKYTVFIAFRRKECSRGAGKLSERTGNTRWEGWN